MNAATSLGAMTDDNSERTGLLPDNETAEPENRREPARLPLKPRDWNHMKVAVTGDMVTLELNGQSMIRPGFRR